MPYIYGLPLYKVLLTMLFSALLWWMLLRFLPKKALRLSAILLLLLSFWGIVRYSVASRAASDQHVFIFSTALSALGEEFYREMAMNIFLYFPLGMALSVLIGLWSIPLAFVLSLVIEAWQYFAGTGIAQATDVICNTLGCAIGALPCIIYREYDRK